MKQQNTTQSQALFERAKKVTPGGVHSPVRAFRGVGGTPRFVRQAQGARITDVDGNTYLDFCMSWGPLIFGHQDADVAEAVRGALGRGWSYGAAEETSLELAEFITSTVPVAQKVRFVNSGTEAVMAALRVARGATGRSKILKFDGCYHGHVDSMLVRAGSGLAEMASPDSAGVSASVAGDTVVVPLDDLDAVRAAFDKHGKDIAAIIVEPVPANNGLLLQRESFLAELIAIAHRHGALMIFDEVITGFRVAFGGMAGRTGLKPDLVTYGKIIGGGFPVGAYAGRAELMDLVAPVGPVYQAGTLSANPVSMAAGLAMLKKLHSTNPYDALERRTATLSERLEKASQGRLRFQNFASMFWGIAGRIDTADGFVRRPDRIPAAQKEEYAKLFHFLLAEGYYFAPSGFEVSFLATAHSDADLDGLVQKVGEYFNSR